MRMLAFALMWQMAGVALAAEPAPQPKEEPPKWVPTQEQHDANVKLMEMKKKGLLLPDRPPRQ